MVDVLLTHTYHLKYDHKQMEKMQPYRPLGTLYAASSLREAGFTVALFDTMLRDPEEFSSYLDHTRPKIVAIYEDDFNFLTKMCLSRMRDVAGAFARVARERKIPVVIHGSDASDNPDIFLDRGIEYLLRGEAEASLVELCHAILKRSVTAHIPGLVHRDCFGNIARSVPPLSQNPNWMRLPMPPLDLTDFETYRQAWRVARGYFSVNMVASRGCPFRCNWCAKPISGNKFHLRPADEVAEEMRLLKTTVDADHIWFSDDVFALNHHWVQDFAREVTARHAATPFKIQSRADLMTYQNVEALRQAGCIEVWMGVESGSQAILDAMDKGLTISEVEDARRRLKYAGIRACYFLQFGYPGERWEELQQTVAFVRNTRPDDIGISFSYPLPGTVFYERVRAELGPKRNWVESDDLCMLFQAEYATDFYRLVRNALHAEVESWTKPSHDLGMLWAEVHRLEPLSRTSQAGDYVSAGRRTSFVGLDQLALKAGA